MLPERYNNHLTTYLKKSEYLMLLIVLQKRANVSKGKVRRVGLLLTYSNFI